MLNVTVACRFLASKMNYNYCIIISYNGPVGFSDFGFILTIPRHLSAVVWNVFHLSGNSSGHPSCASFQSPEANSERSSLHMCLIKPHGRPYWRCFLKARNRHTHKVSFKDRCTLGVNRFVRADTYVNTSQ